MSEKIFINIWDDYHDDGYDPEGESQETFAYTECKLAEEKSKEALIYLKEQIEGLYSSLTPFEMTLSYYDSSKVYPNLIGTEHEKFLYKRWQLQFKNLTHEVRENLIEELEKKPLSLNGVPIEVYSES